MTKSLTHFSLIFSLVFGPHFSQACTVFATQLGTSEMKVAKNFDWEDGQGSLIYSPKGVKRQSLTLFEKDNKPHQFGWTSQLSSITFHLNSTEAQFPPNQTPQDKSRFPMGGMNKAGLTVEVVWLLDTKYPQVNESQKPQLNQLELVRYLLDSASTLTEVETILNKIHVVKQIEKALLHYMACDLDACMVFEFLNGELKVIKNQELKSSILTNVIYNNVVNDNKKDEDYVGRRRVTPPARFAIVRSALTTTPSPSLNEAFDILQKVFVPEGKMATQWSYVYEPKQGIISIAKTNHEGRSESATLSLIELTNQCPEMSAECQPKELSELDSHNNVGPTSQ